MHFHNVTYLKELTNFQTFLLKYPMLCGSILKFCVNYSNLHKRFNLCMKIQLLIEFNSVTIKILKAIFDFNVYRVIVKTLSQYTSS